MRRRTCRSTVFCAVAAAARILLSAIVLAAAIHAAAFLTAAAEPTVTLPLMVASLPDATPEPDVSSLPDAAPEPDVSSAPDATAPIDASAITATPFMDDAASDLYTSSLLAEADRLYANRDSIDCLTAAADLYAAVMGSHSTADETRFHCLVRLICLYDFKGRFLLSNNSDKYEAFRTCEQYATQLTDLYPGSAEGYYRLALALGRQAQVKGLLKGLAIAKPFRENLEKCLEIDPDNVNALMALSRLYLEAPSWPLSFGSKSKAQEYAEKAYSLAPDMPAVMVQMARIEDMQGHRDEAIALLKAVLEADVPDELRLDILEDLEEANELLSRYTE